MAAMDTGRGTVTQVQVDELGNHLATLEAELSDGRAIELVRGDTVIAEVRAKVHSGRLEPPPIPDFMARLRSIWGDEPLDVDMTAVIREDRDARG